MKKSLRKIVQSCVKPTVFSIGSDNRKDLFYRLHFHRKTHCPICITQLGLFVWPQAESYGSCRNCNFKSLNRDILEVKFSKCHSDSDGNLTVTDMEITSDMQW